MAGPSMLNKKKPIRRTSSMSRKPKVRSYRELKVGEISTKYDTSRKSPCPCLINFLKFILLAREHASDVRAVTHHDQHSKHKA
jgi:hypothetical protein